MPLRISVGMVVDRLCRVRCGGSAASLADSVSRCGWRRILPAMVGAASCTRST